MQALTLPARRGLSWISEGFRIYRKKQVMLSLFVLSYWVFMALISAFQTVGQIIGTLLIPVFSVSLMNACRVIEQGGMPTPPLLFSGFNKNLRPLLTLGAVYLAASLVILGLSSLIDDGVLFRLFVLGQKPTDEMLTGDGVMYAGQLALLLFAPLMAAYWFAPVLVAWHDLAPGKALFFSFVACLRNWRVFLVYTLMIMVIGIVIRIAGLISVVFSTLIILVLLPTLYASFYVSYRDVFVRIDENA